MLRLKQIAQLELIKIPRFTPDSYQREILKKLYLEFFFERCRALLKPEGGYFLTGPAQPEEERELAEFVERRPDVIAWLKEYLVYQLSVYSSLLESNSYYITLNDHLIITRFVDVPDHPEDFEVKLYTIGVDELPHNYRDKIYIGRDFLSVTRLHREHFGLKHIRNSLVDQLEKVRARIRNLVPEEEREELENEYVDEFAELTVDFREEADGIIEGYPVEISPRAMDHESLLEANRRFRELKHILIEIEETARELEAVMFERDLHHAVRYVTKYRKDLINYINYIMIKINGRVTDAVNGIHI